MNSVEHAGVAADDELFSAEVELVLDEIVDLTFFCGFSFVEIGAMRSVPERIVQRN